MLTGLLPHEHKAFSRDDYIRLKDSKMIQEILKENGYHTAAFTGGGIACKRNFGRGFDKFRQFAVADFTQDSFEQTQFDFICDKAVEFQWALDYLNNRPIEYRYKPIFLFIHTYYLHAYECERKKKFSDLLAPDTSEVEMRRFFRNLKDTHTGSELKKRYGEVVREFDPILRKFLEEIFNSGISGSLAMIITSDHGEGFGEEYHFPHLGQEYQLYSSMRHSGGNITTSELIRVPLIFYDGKRKGISNQLVDIRDIFGTILNLANPNEGSRTILIEPEQVISENENKILTISDKKGTSIPQRFSFKEEKTPTPPKDSKEMERQLKALGYL